MYHLRRAFLVVGSAVLVPGAVVAFHSSTTPYQLSRTKTLLPPIRNLERQPHYCRYGDVVALQQSTAASDDVSMSSSSDSNKKNTLDVDALWKYGVAIGTQMSLVTGLFWGMDRIISTTQIQIPFVINCIFFYFLALKSRIFNPLSNTRPQPRTLEAGTSTTTTTPTVKRNMPKWTPPGFIFPIVWLLIIGPIRAITSSMIYQSMGSRYASIPILSLMLHLSIGDVWNTINNVERRYGTAVLGVYCVWLSKAHAVYQYGIVNSTAGRLLGATLIWLTIASTLVTATWRINPDPITGKPESLLPVTGKASTKFVWFSQK